MTRGVPAGLPRGGLTEHHPPASLDTLHSVSHTCCLTLNCPFLQHETQGLPRMSHKLAGLWGGVERKPTRVGGWGGTLIC